MAAVQLGLKRRFGGKVDHLRMVLQDEPGKDGGPRKHYVMLYDSVPGGTGYLHQLLAHDAKTLADVLRMALDALTGCSCNQDPEKDGCYRCLYQYRLGRSMELVSRDNAKAVLTELVASLPSLERVKTISDIYINPNFDSVLEARFIESLKKLSGVGGCRREAGSGRRPRQVGLCAGGGQPSATASSPRRAERRRMECRAEQAGLRHLALGDGLQAAAGGGVLRWLGVPQGLHARGRAEAQCHRGQREVLGTWSVTHQDVAAAWTAIGYRPGVAIGGDVNRHDGGKAPPSVPRAQEKAFTQHAVARLLQWLAAPAGAGGDLDRCCRGACSATRRGWSS
jgi:DEAD/DEAH box helicase domain-containing protein